MTVTESIHLFSEFQAVFS